MSSEWLRCYFKDLLKKSGIATSNIDKLLKEIPDQDRTDIFFDPDAREWKTFKQILEARITLPHGKFYESPPDELIKERTDHLRIDKYRKLLTHSDKGNKFQYTYHLDPGGSINEYILDSDLMPTLGDNINPEKLLFNSCSLKFTIINGSSLTLYLYSYTDLLTETKITLVDEYTVNADVAKTFRFPAVTNLHLNLSVDVSTEAYITVTFFFDKSLPLLDEDDMVSDDEDAAASQQSIKAFTESEIADIKLNEINNPDADTTFQFATRSLKFRFTAPTHPTFDGAFEIETIGIFTGDLVHIHQHTGNVGATNLVKIEAEDDDCVALNLAHGANNFYFDKDGLHMVGVSEFDHIGISRAPTATHGSIFEETFQTTGAVVGLGNFPTYAPTSNALNSVTSIQGNVWFDTNNWASGSNVRGLDFFPAPIQSGVGSANLNITGISTGGLLNIAGRIVTAADIAGLIAFPIANIFGGTDSTTCDNVRGILIPSAVATLGVWGVLQGLEIQPQTGAVIDRGLFLSGDGLGSDLVLGAEADANFYYDGVDVVLNPKVKGSGGLKLSSSLIKDVSDPTSAQEAATKNYVDTTINNYIHLRDEKPQNTIAGTFTQGAWRTRDLNTEVADLPGVCSLAANQFTLEAGTYIINASAPAYTVRRHQTRLYNISDTSVEIIGTSEYASLDGSVGNRSFVIGVFTIAAQKVFEIQHICQLTAANLGFGVDGDFTTEVFTEVELWKVP